MSESGGTGEGEVDVNVVEGNGKVSAGARKGGEPEGEAEGDDNECGPEVEGEGAMIARDVFGMHYRFVALLDFILVATFLAVFRMEATTFFPTVPLFLGGVAPFGNTITRFPSNATAIC